MITTNTHQHEWKVVHSATTAQPTLREICAAIDCRATRTYLSAKDATQTGRYIMLVQSEIK